MSDDLPVFTMTTARQIDDTPADLDEKSAMLMQTLQTLCSFYSASDAASFVFSEMFQNLAWKVNAWQIYEFGLYSDHTKTVELIPSSAGITIADASSTGAFAGDVQVYAAESEFADAVQNWHDLVWQESNRFN